jgi:hypothetical protein
MNTLSPISPPARALLLVPLLLIAASSALAGGDHAGGHDHDAVTPTTDTPAQPRVVAESERFELVGTLTDSELSMLIDHAPSNEPVLGAKLTVDVAGRRVPAKFHADHGDYAVDDATALAALRRDGGALAFVIDAGGEPDLLAGELIVAAPDHDAHDAHDAADTGEQSKDRTTLWLALAGGVAAIAVLILLWRRRTRRPAQGAAQ